MLRRGPAVLEYSSSSSARCRVAFVFFQPRLGSADGTIGFLQRREWDDGDFCDNVDGTAPYPGNLLSAGDRKEKEGGRDLQQALVR